MYIYFKLKRIIIKLFVIYKKKIFISKGFSNIALIKYWGKYNNQIPGNPSISYRLNKSYSETKLIFNPRNNIGNNFSVKIFLSGKERPDFIDKILNFFKKIYPYCPYLMDFDFIIKTKNTFPHSSGIASSASSISSLTLCLIKFEKIYYYKLLNNNNFLQRASFLARLGSGSACRSIYPGLVVWGKTKKIKYSSNEYAIQYPINKIHNIFFNYCDTILIIDSNPKKMSSSLCHKLVMNNYYIQQRFKSAKKNFDKLLYSLKNGDIKLFGEIIEHEALSIHAIIMSSNPYLILIKANTLNVIEKIIKFRQETNKPLYFTLDAGANVHLLYPNIEKDIIQSFIKKNLLKYCYKKKYIEDYCFFNDIKDYNK